jgi:hypothetical protein
VAEQAIEAAKPQVKGLDPHTGHPLEQFRAMRPSTLVRMNFIMRLFTRIGLAMTLGWVGFFLLIIPPVGALVLLSAAMAPFICVFRPTMTDRLRGQCPHCCSNVKVRVSKTRDGGFNCPTCKNRIIARPGIFAAL